MKLEDKKELSKTINTDIYIGICLGILGNALYIYLSTQFNIIGVIEITSIILLFLIYKKEEELTKHYRNEISSNFKITNKEILDIRGIFLNKVESTWKANKENKIDFPNSNIIQFLLENIYIFRITFKENEIYLDYYQGSNESEYLKEEFIKILKVYQVKDKKLFLDEVFNEMNSPKIILGPVKYKS